MTANSPYHANLHLAHHNMVEQQIRPWDVLDERVLQTLARVARADYVPAAYKALAYADTAIPLDHGQEMMHPVVEGRMLQALAIQPTDHVLEIGTGSGYITACLATLAAHVESVDIDADFTQRAAAKLKEHDIYNVKLVTADATTGPQPGRQWDVIVFTGAMCQESKEYLQALKPGGRLFVICGEDPVMKAKLITRTTEQNWSEQILFETSLKQLLGAEHKKHFVF